jgi:hypothetical protein
MMRTKPRWMVDSVASEDWNEAIAYSLKKKYMKVGIYLYIPLA